MTTISASTTLGVVLNPATYTNPVVIDAGVVISNSGGSDAITISGAATYFLIQNGGIISGSGFGIYLAPGGSVINSASGSVTGGLFGVYVDSGAGTVVNNGSIAGTIVAAGTPSNGVFLAAGGSVTNAASAAISGGDQGVVITGGVGAVINYGSIAGAGTAGSGVALDAGGSVTNAAAATITGGNDGVAVGGGAGTVVNGGSIAGTGTSSNQGIGVFMAAGGSVTNTATASITGTYRGIDMAGAGTVVNQGSIAGTGTNRDGIALLGGGVVTNAVQATISGGFVGVFINGNTASVVNYGSIVGTLFNTGAGVAFFSSGTVTNAASASISGVYIGINMGSPPVTGAGLVLNGGSIAGTGTKSIGVRLLGGGTVTNTGAGSITGVADGIYITGGPTVVANDGGITGTGAVSAGIDLHSIGSVTNAAFAAITGDVFGVRLFAGGTLSNAGTISGGSGTAVAFGVTGGNLLVLHPGFGFSGLVIGGASASNTMELASAASAGAVAGLGTEFLNFHSIEFDAGAHWLISGNTVGLAGTINGFAPGDTIEVTGVSETGSSFSNGILTLTETGGSATLVLPGNFTTDSFIVTRNAEGTEVTLPAPCFCAGTRLLTPAGEIAVEDLAPGDLLVTALGRRRPVRWTGHRHIDLARHRRPQDVYPVRVHEQAIAPDVPHRDLLLSPDHALFLDGVLIPVRYLCNGATIRQEAYREVCYFHVELDAHDIVLAEGLPAESYLDTGNRGAFANGGDVAPMHADFVRGIWANAACAPLVVAGAKLTQVRRRLLDRAVALGHAQTADAGLCLLADGAAVWPEIDGNVFHFSLLRRAAALRLVSRRIVPAELSADGTDGRRLGVAVARLTVDGHELPPHDPDHAGGWYPPEPGWQWTDGDATLRGSAESRVEVTLVPLLRYWARRRQDGMPLVVEYSKCSAVSGNTIG